ncbi:MAG TPA: hypothetical protein VK447_15540 [Myxococcaceae bacterium]|nr:hypothetical protein [Myxococcaceae bacterium]
MSTVERRDLGSGRILLVNPKGQVEVSRRGRNVVFVQYKGYINMELLTAIHLNAEEHLRELETVQLFVDATSVDGTDPGFRQAWTERFKQFRGRVTGCILIRSALLKMTIQFINLFAGKERAVLEPVTDRAEFERRLQAALQS